MRRSVKKISLFLAVLCFVMAGCQEKTKEQITLEQTDVQEEKASEEERSLYVDVCGEVSCPGVYELPVDSRMFQAIEAAGGFTAEACVSGVNQAQKLEDGQQIYVPSREEVQAAADASAQSAKDNSDGKVNLNTASREELLTLTGIGEVRADSIIRYREANGGFHSIEELKEVEGIKDGVFQKVKDKIKI